MGKFTEILLFILAILSGIFCLGAITFLALMPIIFGLPHWTLWIFVPAALMVLLYTVIKIKMQ